MGLSHRLLANDNLGDASKRSSSYNLETRPGTGNNFLAHEPPIFYQNPMGNKYGNSHYYYGSEAPRAQYHPNSPQGYWASSSTMLLIENLQEKLKTVGIENGQLKFQLEEQTMKTLAYREELTNKTLAFREELTNKTLAYRNDLGDMCTKFDNQLKRLIMARDDAVDYAHSAKNSLLECRTHAERMEGEIAQLKRKNIEFAVLVSGQQQDIKDLQSDSLMLNKTIKGLQIKISDLESQITMNQDLTNSVVQDHLKEIERLKTIIDAVTIERDEVERKWRCIVNYLKQTSANKAQMGAHNSQETNNCMPNLNGGAQDRGNTCDDGRTFGIQEDGGVEVEQDQDIEQGGAQLFDGSHTGQPLN